MKHSAVPTGSILPQRRADALEAERHRKMARSAHAFVRGSTLQFYDWLSAPDGPSLPDGPPVWICGDCHVGNLGPVASVEGTVAIQIRDLDQTNIGNPAHDMIRLALSLAMAARGSDLPGVTTAHMLERMVHGYATAFKACEQGDVVDAEREMPHAVRQVMRSAAGRSWKHLADERIEGRARTIPLGKRFWPLTEEERCAVDELFMDDSPRRLVTSLRAREESAPVRVLDAAFWRKGCSSLGLLRVAVLLAVGVGKAERHCLIDIKEATDAATPAYTSKTPLVDPAERVVTGAKSLSPFLGKRMMAATLLGRPIFIRELLPQDLKLEIEHLSVDEAISVAEFLAHVVGRGHSRQMGVADRDRWIQELARNRSASLDAPCWLWDSVVELVGLHEAAYLRHCRRWALVAAV